MGDSWTDDGLETCLKVVEKLDTPDADRAS